MQPKSASENGILRRRSIPPSLRSNSAKLRFSRFLPRESSHRQPNSQLGFSLPISRYEYGRRRITKLTDNLSAVDRRRAMQAVRSRNTSLERRVRALLIRGGFREWRVNPKGVDGHPDFAFLNSKIAIFVDGCFWHGCTNCRKPLPKSNRVYWARKIERTVERDSETTRRLIESGWMVVRIWEHDLEHDYGLQQISDSLSPILGAAAS